MPLAFEATIFPYFEKAVVQTAQNKAQLSSFRPAPLHRQQLLYFGPGALALGSIPWKFCTAGSASQWAVKPGAAVQLLVRQSGTPHLGPEW